MQQFDYLVVLCASTMNNQGKFLEYDDGGLYIGGQTRMDAALRLASRVSRKILLVGGNVDATDPQQKWQKVRDMQQFLVNHGVDRQRLVCIASQPNTLGNLRAIYATYGSKLEGQRVGVLTNFYHMLRALRMAADPQFDWRVTFIPIIAEAQFELRNSVQGDNITAFTQQVIRNIRGVQDWESGLYEEQFTPKSLWRGEIYHANGLEEKLKTSGNTGELAISRRKR